MAVHSDLLFSFLPSGDSRDIELWQQKQISIRVSKSERHCAEKGLMEAQLGALFTLTVLSGQEKHTHTHSRFSCSPNSPFLALKEFLSVFYKKKH